jgi:CYTH domain-containing protein
MAARGQAQSRLSQAVDAKSQIERAHEQQCRAWRQQVFLNTHRRAAWIACKEKTHARARVQPSTHVEVMTYQVEQKRREFQELQTTIMQPRDMYAVHPCMVA